MSQGVSPWSSQIMTVYVRSSRNAALMADRVQNRCQWTAVKILRKLANLLKRCKYVSSRSERVSDELYYGMMDVGVEVPCVDRRFRRSGNGSESAKTELVPLETRVPKRRNSAVVRGEPEPRASEVRATKTLDPEGLPVEVE